MERIKQKPTNLIFTETFPLHCILHFPFILISVHGCYSQAWSPRNAWIARIQKWLKGLIINTSLSQKHSCLLLYAERVPNIWKKAPFFLGGSWKADFWQIGDLSGRGPGHDSAAHTGSQPALDSFQAQRKVSEKSRVALQCSAEGLACGRGAAIGCRSQCVSVCGDRIMSLHLGGWGGFAWRDFWSNIKMFPVCLG